MTFCTLSICGEFIPRISTVKEWMVSNSMASRPERKGGVVETIEV